MFYYLNGKITHLESFLAVVDCGGVGYAVHTSARTLGTLKTGANAKLFTYAHIREDAFDIYGFATQAELNTFKLLIGVSGVGTRSALSILSASAPEDLAIAIASGNDKLLTAAPGIGKKIAQRIILELKDKIAKDMSDLPAMFGSGGGGNVSGGLVGDVTAALAVLGYTPAEISSALRTIPAESLETGDTGEIIRQILKNSVKG
ncbi:MAG: Holliday junction branch migration protein RuvA [Oscillospiraceae bacterium]|jgi:Holliday junction DNA helicase RuvA|nr:Holliday junction branch migration protein RuvA [Oscillospiraceae bacterium]